MVLKIELIAECDEKDPFCRNIWMIVEVILSRNKRSVCCESCEKEG